MMGSTKGYYYDVAGLGFDPDGYRIVVTKIPVPPDSWRDSEGYDYWGSPEWSREHMRVFHGMEEVDSKIENHTDADHIAPRVPHIHVVPTSDVVKGPAALEEIADALARNNSSSESGAAYDTCAALLRFVQDWRPR